MTGLIVPQGASDIVNLLESKHCCFCGGLVSKRKQMWKYSDGNYMCISCKTCFDEDKVKETPCSADATRVIR